MSRLYHEHPETLRMEGRVTAEDSAVMWLEQMKPEQRLAVMKKFCPKCGSNSSDHTC
jgi:hypothetical protein